MASSLKQVRIAYEVIVLIVLSENDGAEFFPANVIMLVQLLHPLHFPRTQSVVLQNSVNTVEDNDTAHAEQIFSARYVDHHQMLGPFQLFSHLIVSCPIDHSFDFEAEPLTFQKTLLPVQIEFGLERDLCQNFHRVGVVLFHNRK